MKTLFNRVFDGSDEMFAKAEEEVNKIVAEVGRDAPLTLPSTAYFCACIYAYIGKKVTTTGELQDALADVKAMMLSIVFCAGLLTALLALALPAAAGVCAWALSWPVRLVLLLVRFFDFSCAKPPPIP